MSRRVLIAIPAYEFDPTEVAVPWNTLKKAGFEVVFCTPDGKTGHCDPRVLAGVIFGQLGARPENVALYQEMSKSPEFCSPIAYENIQVADYAGLVLPGGHAPGMKPYLESTVLQEAVREFFGSNKKIGAICHGVLVAARACDPNTGRSVIAERHVTALPKFMERAAYYVSFWKLGRYYRTYPSYVQDEVRAALSGRSSFSRGPLSASYARPFVVRDGNLVTARWPGDAQKFADTLVMMLKES